MLISDTKKMTKTVNGNLEKNVRKPLCVRYFTISNKKKNLLTKDNLFTFSNRNKNN